MTKYEVLIVDDSAISRKKLAAAVRHLGHNVTEADGGHAGLQALENNTIHLVRLDIVMPDLDGYDVLREMRSSPTLTEIPVLVISSVDDTKGIVQAIDLGAVDFLPKNVDSKVLEARVQTTLERKRLRDQELAYLSDVVALTEAARTVRETDFNPLRLDTEGVEKREDALGELARVFKEMAGAVHRREVAFRRQIDLLRGGFLLILIGTASGLYPALSKILVSTSINNPLGMTAWVALITMALSLVGLFATGKIPKFTRSRIKFALIIGPFAGAIPQVALFFASEHVPAVTLSITLALQALMVFALSALVGIEKPTFQRLVGLMFGMVAVALVILPASAMSAIGNPIWMFVAMLVPLSYAVENLMLAAMPDKAMGPLEMVFFLMLGSTGWAWLAAGMSGNTLEPDAIDLTRWAVMGLIAFVSCFATWLLTIIIRRAGAIFASQYGYVTTFMGVLWSLVLLDETTTRWIWLALAFMVTGMALVRPKESDELMPIKRGLEAKEGAMSQ